MQKLQIRWQRIRRKTAIADNFTGDTLRDFLRPALENLKIGMAVGINESRCYDEPAAIDDQGIGRPREDAGGGDDFSVDQNVAWTGLGARSID